MKLRSTLILATLLLCFGATSCVKDYTCQCEISYSGKPGLPDTLLKEYKIRDSKKNAESLCEGNSANSEDNGIKTVEDCSLY